MLIYFWRDIYIYREREGTFKKKKAIKNHQTKSKIQNENKNAY